MITTEPLREGDQRQVHVLARMAFGERSPFDADRPRLADHEHTCVYEGDRLIASAGTIPFTQTFGGRAVPCGGVTGVMVAPDHRGYGLARTVVAASLAAMRERGQWLSALYPTTTTLYRGVGYEVAGWWETSKLPMSALPTAPDRLDWSCTELDDPAVAEVMTTMARDNEGWVAAPTVSWARAAHIARQGERDSDTWVGRRSGRPAAVVALRYRDSRSAVFDLTADHLGGIDHEALVDALAFVGRHATTADAVVTSLPRHLLATLVEHPQRASVTDSWPWMLRIVDIPRALESRGWNPHVVGTIDLEVDDPLLGSDQRRWRMSWSGGRATLEPGGNGGIRLDVATLASCYAGSVDIGALAGAGRLDGIDTGSLQLLVAAGSAPTPPTLPIFF
ncbi:MAG: enhanced intracellular survival protein Eis [Acidimicrobiales bacterium]